MRAASVFIGVLAFVGYASAATPQPGFISRIRNSSRTDTEDLISLYLSSPGMPWSPVTANTTSAANETSTAQKANKGRLLLKGLSHPVGDNDLVPIHDLPVCYQKCFHTNCCNGLFGDIHDLTKHEFCESKRFLVGHWMLDHVQYCTGKECRACGNDCRDSSTKWLLDLCGHPMGRN
ncbi:hypothetical protein F5X99DRAFT_394634 [Biscogniauxia marginata]|nr:hypothetical protein F5X99DRAFT_394634 [Biscogniauxia marginata]